jgi:hypothetical protein
MELCRYLGSMARRHVSAKQLVTSARCCGARWCPRVAGQPLAQHGMSSYEQQYVSGVASSSNFA